MTLPARLINQLQALREAPPRLTDLAKLEAFVESVRAGHTERNAWILREMEVRVEGDGALVHWPNTAFAERRMIFFLSAVRVFSPQIEAPQWFRTWNRCDRTLGDAANVTRYGNDWAEDLLGLRA